MIKSQEVVKTAFFGTSEFAVPALKYLIQNGYDIIAVVTQPEKPVGRTMTIMPSPIKKSAIENNILVFEPHNLKNDDNFFKSFKHLNPDLCIVAAYGKIIPYQYLEIPRLGFINIHPSLLPKYRGPSPIQAAILNGDKETGVAIIKLDEEMDHGAILANHKSQIINYKYYKELESELSKLSPDKRAATEKWKRLELKAKLKIEEQTLEEESKKYESRASDEGKRPEGDYKKALEEINKKQGELKQGISDLEGQKGQILREKGKISEDVQNKGSKIQKIRLRLENAAKEHAFLRSEWSKLKSELPRLNLDFFANVLSEFKDKAQNKLKGRKQKEQQRLAEERKKQLEAKKGNLEEEGRKQKEKEKEEKLRKEEGAKEQKELERRRYAIELKNQKELETKKRIEDERIKDEENKRKLEIKEKLAKEGKKKFSEFFHKIGLYKTPEEKKQAALLKEKQRQEKRRLEQEDFRKKEEGKKQKEKEKEEKLRKEEEAKKQKGLERRRAEEHNKIEELEKEVKELERQRDEKRNLQEVEKEVPEKKTKWFEGLFKKKKAELEEAKEEAGEEPEEAEEGGVDKSENLGEFYKLLNGIKQAINGKDISKAKKLYKEAWEIYASLKYEEQKEVYGKFMKSYNQLSKK